MRWERSLMSSMSKYRVNRVLLKLSNLQVLIANYMQTLHGSFPSCRMTH